MQNPPFATGEVLGALRTATAESHRRLEQVARIESRLENLAGYASLLQCFLGFYRPLEDRLMAIHGWPEAGVDWSARRKTPWLTADLQALDQDVLLAGDVPDSPFLPPARTLLQGFGCLYVLEGATLGGRQISRLLLDSPVPSEARRFFHGYGEETGARWREFLAALENMDVASGASGRQEIVAGAGQTFACLLRWMEERTPAL